MFECKLCDATDCDCDFDEEIKHCDNCGQELDSSEGIICDICSIDEEE